MENIPRPEQVRAARIAAGLTQQECAERFGYLLRSWQKKEQAGDGGRTLSPGEFELLMLLADQHPILKLIKR